MRQFSNRNSWLDEKGNPLVGRVKFCALHTSTPENIYDFEGTVLDNPMFTNNIGQLMNQVFLADKAYTVRFEKYIGNGRMEDDTDEQNWLFMYSCDNLYDVFNISVESDSLQSISNIEELRNTNPPTIETREGIKILTLEGYNVPGDKPAVRYIWNESSVENDNGGSVIKVADIATGRWELVNDFNSKTGVDVRHFGVFGKDIYSDVEANMPAKIDIANTYANSIGLPLYFGSDNGDEAWFKINSNLNGAIFAKHTTIFADTGSTANITVTDEESYLNVWSNADYNSAITIKGTVVKTSWGVNSSNVTFDPNLTLVIDSAINTHNKTFSNIQVKVLTLCDSCEFVNCEIESFGKIGDDCVFRGCKLTEQMFDVQTENITVYDDDIIDIEDWPTTSKWLYLVTQNSAQTLDFKGRTLDATCSIDWASCSYKNAVFNGYTVTNSTVYMKDCYGTFTLGSQVSNISISDSDFLAITPYNGVVGTMNLTNCKAVSFNTDVTFAELYAVNCTFNDSNKTYSPVLNGFRDCIFNCKIDTTYITCEGCTVNGLVNCSVPNMNKCVINSVINQVAQTNQADFLFYGCTFTDNGEHSLSSTVPLTQVIGTWDSNFCPSKHPITVSLQNIVNSDVFHTYKYVNNTGKFRERYPKVVYTDNGMKRFPVFPEQDNPDYDNHTSPRVVLANRNQWISGNFPMCNGVWIPSLFKKELPMFSIGARSVMIKMKVSFMVTDSTGYAESSTRLYNYRLSFEGTRQVNIPNPEVYEVTEFNQTYLGPMCFYPRNSQSPQDPDGQGCACYVEIEILE